MNKLVKYIIESRFNFNVDQLDLENNEEDFSLSKQQYKSKSMKQEYLENANFVDLGLPSGILWSKYNLGVNSRKLDRPKDWLGNYYMWGNKKLSKTCIASANDQIMIVNNQVQYKKYCNIPESAYKQKSDCLTELQPEDDAATFALGQNFKTPNIENFRELIRNTTQKPVNHYNDIDSLRGVLFISKINGNSIFFPFNGTQHGKAIYGENDKEIFVWSSTLSHSPDRAYVMFYNFYDKEVVKNELVRWVGAAIRPVKVK